jgi:predicted NUDIX family phosphoesterase
MKFKQYKYYQEESKKDAEELKTKKNKIIYVLILLSRKSMTTPMIISMKRSSNVFK